MPEVVADCNWLKPLDPSQADNPYKQVGLRKPPSVRCPVLHAARCASSEQQPAIPISDSVVGGVSWCMARLSVLPLPLPLPLCRLAVAAAARPASPRPVGPADGRGGRGGAVGAGRALSRCGTACLGLGHPEFTQHCRGFRRHATHARCHSRAVQGRDKERHWFMRQQSHAINAVSYAATIFVSTHAHCHSRVMPSLSRVPSKLAELPSPRHLIRSVAAAPAPCIPPAE